MTDHNYINFYTGAYNVLALTDNGLLHGAHGLCDEEILMPDIGEQQKYMKAFIGGEVHLSDAEEALALTTTGRVEIGSRMTNDQGTDEIRC